MASNNFDYSDYEKSLEKVLSMTEKDYWVQYIDVNRHQVNVARTYLWVSAALLGAYVAFYEQYKNTILSSSLCPVLLLIISFVAAVLAFGLCLYAIPARKGYKSIADPSWGEFSQQAHALLSQKDQNQYISMLSSLIDRVDSSTYHNVGTNQKRAKLLRATSWILIFSFCSALISGVSFAVSKLEVTVKPTKMEATMTPDDNNTDTTSDAPASPAVEKPNVPTPAGPIGQGSGQPNYTTHGLNPAKGVVRATEGLDSVKPSEEE
jgi:hypothetical protein